MGQKCSSERFLKLIFEPISKQVTTSRGISPENPSRNCNRKQRKRHGLKDSLGKSCFCKIRNDQADDCSLEILEQACVSR